MKDIDMMTEQQEIFPFKEGEQYVNLLQENITRMATNSANCKNWLIGIVGGALAIVFANDASSGQIHMILCVLKVFTILLFLLDCFYLGVERRFKKAERLFVKKCKENNESDAKILLMSFSKSLVIEEKSPNDSCIIQLKNIKQQVKDTLCAMVSLSTTPFYGVILIVLCKLSKLS